MSIITKYNFKANWSINDPDLENIRRVMNSKFKKYNLLVMCVVDRFKNLILDIVHDAEDNNFHDIYTYIPDDQITQYNWRIWKKSEYGELTECIFNEISKCIAGRKYIHKIMRDLKESKDVVCSIAEFRIHYDEVCTYLKYYKKAYISILDVDKYAAEREFYYKTTSPNYDEDDCAYIFDMQYTMETIIQSEKHMYIFKDDAFERTLGKPNAIKRGLYRPFIFCADDYTTIDIARMITDSVFYTPIGIEKDLPEGTNVNTFKMNIDYDKKYDERYVQCEYWNTTRCYIVDQFW